MLLNRATLDGIEAGRVDRAFRRWSRPTVKAGGTLVTPVGVLAIDVVEPIDQADLTDDDAVGAGFASAAELARELDRWTGHDGRPPRARTSRGGTARPDGQLYRVRFHVAGADPRVALRESVDLSDADVAGLAEKLDGMDRRRGGEPWTRPLLRLIEANEGVRAPDLAAGLGRDTAKFKTDVRKLKELGLTESLLVGYRLSPRGRAFLGRDG